jgi:Ca-activated chloride channel family protein
VLELGSVLLLVAAIARPVLVEVEPPGRLGRDILLCFDRSSSMAANDLDPEQSRLAVGKQLASEFTAERPDDRIGFVTFARYADLGCPPTVDHAALAELIDEVALVEREGPEDATAIGAAVATAASVLQRSSAAGKVIVLLTDGEENVATAGAIDQIAPGHAGQWCRQQQIRVHTVVLGRGNQKPDGRFVALDTTAVRELAELTGGRFFAAADTAALRAVYAAIDALEPVLFAEPGVRVHEWFALPLVLALALLALAHGLANSPLGGTP